MDIKRYLEKKGIKFRCFSHPPVFTCDDAEKHYKRIGMKAMHCKNLFLKDRKSKRFFLVVLPAKKMLDLSKLSKSLGQKIKFSNEKELRDILSLNPGSVSPFGLVNDKEKKVEVIVDRDVWDSALVSFHPNVNTETLEISNKDFHAFLGIMGNKREILDL